MNHLIALTLAAIMFVVRAEETQAEEISDVTFDDEFLQGMESGFFLRNNLEGYKDYQCPELVVN